MTPRLEACYFNPDNLNRWDRMARVLAATAAEFCPGWRVNVERIAPVPFHHRLGNRKILRNSQKLERWREIVAASHDGDRLLLMDVDMMITRPLDPVWDRDFDVAYTTKPSAYPLNGGVVFLRVSPTVRVFMDTWADVNRQMLHDPNFHQPWKRQYAGINQAALGCILTEQRTPDVRFLALPCLEWNCEDVSWTSFDPTVTRIVHIKAALQLACLERQPIPPELAQLTALWKARDREAQAMAARSA